MRGIVGGLLGAACFFSPSVEAQRANEGGRLNTYDYLNRELGHARLGALPTGSPSLLPYWALGTVTMRAGNVQAHQWLKYNLAAGQLLWRRPQSDSVELFTTLVRGFSLRDSAQHHAHVYRLYPDVRTAKPLLRTVFFDVRYDDGRTALLCQRRRQVRTQGAGGTLNTTRYTVWAAHNQYFLKLPDHTLRPVRLAAKSIVAALAEPFRTQAATYVKTQHLDLRREDDVYRLLAYYSTLQP